MTNPNPDSEELDKIWEKEFPPKIQPLHEKGMPEGLKQDLEQYITSTVNQARVDTRDIEDWVKRGLESTNSNVWYKCLQMIEHTLSAPQVKEKS